MISRRKLIQSGLAAGAVISCNTLALASVYRPKTNIVLDVSNLNKIFTVGHIPHTVTTSKIKAAPEFMKMGLDYFPTYIIANSVDWLKKYNDCTPVIDRCKQIFEVGFDTKIADDAFSTLHASAIDNLRVKSISSVKEIEESHIVWHHDYDISNGYYEKVCLGINPKPEYAFLGMSWRSSYITAISESRMGLRGTQTLSCGVLNKLGVTIYHLPGFDEKLPVLRNPYAETVRTQSTFIKVEQ